MQISSVSHAYGASPADLWAQQADSAGQNLPGAAQAAQYGQANMVSSPRASLAASATAVMSQSVDEVSSRIDISRQAAVYQSIMNGRGLFGYQATLGAPLVG